MANRLADLLGEAVTGIENGDEPQVSPIRSVEAPAHKPHLHAIPLTQTGSFSHISEIAHPTTPVFNVDTASDDTFGIAYKKVALPGAKPAAGYVLPAGPAFAGERELEREAEENAAVSEYLVASLGGAQVNQGGVDEFDEFGDSDSGVPVQQPQKNAVAMVSPPRAVVPRIFSSDADDSGAKPVAAAGLPVAPAPALAPPRAGAAPMRGNLVFTAPIAPGGSVAATATQPSAITAGAQALQAVRAQLAADADRERRAELADIEKRLLGAGSLAAAPLISVAEGGGGEAAVPGGKTVSGKNTMSSVEEGSEDENDDDEEEEGQATPQKTAASPIKIKSAALQKDKPLVASKTAVTAPALEIAKALAPSLASRSPEPAAQVTVTVPLAHSLVMKPSKVQQKVAMITEEDFDESQRAAAAADFEASAAAVSAARHVSRPKILSAKATRALLYAEASAAVMSPAAAAPHRSTILPVVSDPDKSCLARLIAPQLAAPLRDERDRIFCCAKQQYSTGNSVHARLMDALFAGITGSEISGDWTVIGFQRPEGFETDLRGAGMLGPLCMLWLSETHRRFVDHLFALSRSESQKFPLMAQSLTMTAKALLALRFGRLNKAANDAAAAGAESPVEMTFHEFFGALWLEFLRLYRERAGTIAQLGAITTEATAAVMKNATAAIAAFRVAMAKPPFA